MRSLVISIFILSGLYFPVLASAATPVPKFAYVANSGSNSVSVYAINPTNGALTAGTTVPTGTGPRSVTVDPSGKFAYVANNSNNVSVYTINQTTGALTVGTPVTSGSGSRSVTVDPSGKFAYVANTTSNNVSVYTIDQTTGALTAGTPVATGTAPCSVTVDPSGKFAYVANNGSNSVSVYTINQTTGALTAGTPVTTGTAPRSVTVSPSGKFAYVANYGSSSNNVSVYTINQTTGALTAGTPVTAGSAPLSVTVDPFGKFAYVANNSSNNVSVYTINQTTGALTAGTPVTSGTAPCSVTVDPSGKFAYVANFSSNNVSVYTINQTTGALTAGTPVATGSNPLSVTTTGGVATVPGAPVAISAAPGNTQATVSFTAPADSGGLAITGYTVTASPGGLTATGSVSPIIVTGLINDTAYTFTVTATNGAGTGGASAASNTVTASKSSQTVSFGTAPTIIVGGTGTVSATASSGLAVSFSSNTPAVCTILGSTVTGITAGNCIIAANQAGDENYNAANQVTQSVNINSLTVQITSPAQGFTKVNTPKLTYAVSYGTVTVTLDGNIVNVANNGNFSTLSDGTHTVTVEAVDAGDNKVSSSVTFTVVTAPNLSLSTLADNQTTDSEILNITGSLTDPSGIANFTINGVDLKAQAENFSQAVQLIPGTNTVTTVASDTLGNQLTDERRITFDITAPFLAVTSPSDNSTSRIPFVTVSGAIAPGSTVDIAVNQGTPQTASLSGTSFNATVNLVEGLNTIVVTATDLNGRTTAAKRSVFADTAKMSLAITDPAQDVRITSNSLLLRGTVADADSPVSVTVSAAGASYNPLVSNGTFEQSLTFGEEKTYPVMVTATDENGISAGIQRNVIYALGLISINQGVEVTTSTTVTLSLAYHPAATMMRFCFNNSDWTPWASYATTKTVLVPAGNGVKTVYVQFLGLDGKESPTYFDSIRLDTPIGTITYANAPLTIKVPVGSATGSYTVSWGASATKGVTYVLEEATNSAFTKNLQVVSTGTALSKALTGRSMGATYYYRVKATKAEYGDSAWKAGAAGCAVPGIVAGTPATLTVKPEDADGNFAISWTAPTTKLPPVVEYVLQEATNSTFTGATELYRGSQPTYAVSGRSRNVTYYYRVKAAGAGYKDSLWKPGANGCRVLLENEANKAPLTIKVPAGSATGSYTVSWGASATKGVTYVLEEATNSAFTANLQVVSTGTALSKALTGRALGATYYYRVKATKAEYGDSDWKAGAAGCAVPGIVAGTPATLTVKPEDADGNFAISWTAPTTKLPPVVEYVLQEATNSTFIGATELYRGSALTSAVSGLSLNVTYFYRVKALGAGYKDSLWKVGTMRLVPEFTLAATSVVTAAQGGSGTATISTTVTGGFNASVALSTNGLPPGATTNFSQATVAAPGSGSTTLTLTAGASTPPGTYAITVTGTGNGKTHTAIISFKVTALPVPVMSFNPNALTFAPQDNFTTSVAQDVVLSNTGNTGILLKNNFITWPMNAQWIIKSNTCPDPPSVFKAGATCIVSIAFSPRGDDQLRANYSLQKQLGYDPAPIPPDSYSGVLESEGDSVTNPQIAIPKQTVLLNGTGVYTPEADFTLAAPSEVTASQGGSTMVTISTTVAGNFNAAVALTKSGVPTGATATFSTTSIVAPGSGSATLKLTAGASTPVGMYTITVTGAGGGKTHTTTISFRVTTPTIESFAGTYSGTYSGDDSGTINVTLGINGSISGSGRSTVDPTYQFTISGQVGAGGTVSLQGSGSAGTATFTGTITPQGVLSGTWSAGVEGGTFTTKKTTTGAVPTVTSISPAQGVPGTTITITGADFTNANFPTASVTFGGGVAATGANLVLISATKIVVKVPSGAATGPITIRQTPAGASAVTTSFTVSSNSGSVPTVTGMSPSTGAPGTTMIITGTNFSSTPANNTVKINGTLANVTVATTTSLTVTVPSSATTGTVSVTTAGGTAKSIGTFTVTDVIASSSITMVDYYKGTTTATIIFDPTKMLGPSASYKDNIIWRTSDDSADFTFNTTSMLSVSYNDGFWVLSGSCISNSVGCTGGGATYNRNAGTLHLDKAPFNSFVENYAGSYISGDLYFKPAN